MRIEMAAASAARSKASAARQAAENAQLRNRMKTTSVRTDDDIMDEEAGRARLRMAAESKARKAAEEARIREENARNAERLKQTTSKTNDGGELFVKRSFSTFARKEPEPLMRETFMHASTFQRIAPAGRQIGAGGAGARGEGTATAAEVGGGRGAAPAGDGARGEEQEDSRVDSAEARDAQRG